MLLQITQDRFNNCVAQDRGIVQKIKFAANKMIKLMDELLNKNYNYCNKEQLYQADEIHKLIYDKIKEAEEIYMRDAEN